MQTKVIRCDRCDGMDLTANVENIDKGQPHIEVKIICNLCGVWELM